MIVYYSMSGIHCLSITEYSLQSVISSKVSFQVIPHYREKPTITCNESGSEDTEFCPRVNASNQLTHIKMG